EAVVWIAQPEWRRFSGGLVLPVDDESDLLEQRSYVVAQGAPLIFDPDQHDNLDRLAVVAPDAVLLASAELFHLPGDDGFGALKIMAVLELDGADGLRGPGV